MTINKLIQQALKCFKVSNESWSLTHPAPGLTLLKSSCPSKLEATVYKPAICLILQGAKETIIGDRVIHFGAGQSLIVSHTVPVTSRITKASDSEPYLAMILDINLSLLRSLHFEIDELPTDERQPSALSIETAEDDLLSAMSKYLALANQSLEMKVMGPLLLKEIHFRMLMAPHGSMLRKLMVSESYPNQISKAISHLREHFKEPLSVKVLANSIGMSESSFYSNFKKVTETSPLQYQKDMRLIEAQRLLRKGDTSVSTVAFEVGYESPTHFSREYARKFGSTPKTELELSEHEME